MPTVLVSSSASLRIERASNWLLARAPAEELLVVGTSADAVNDLLRNAATNSEAGASFGWHRASLGRLAAELAQAPMIEADRIAVSPLAAEALAARVVHEAQSAGSLGRYEAVWETPGFASALARVFDEIRLANLSGDALARIEAELRELIATYGASLETAGLVDRAAVFEFATDRVRSGKVPHPWIGLPVLLLDAQLWTAAEEALLSALVEHAPDVFATAPAGDEESIERLKRMGLDEEQAPPDGASSLRRIQAHLFEDATAPEAPLDDDVEVLSAPGESRESVELARKLLEHARHGTRFDRMAILLRSPEEYRPHLEEALGRAGIPAHFARGAIVPDPAGRAFLALLSCAKENLSARRFAEYLSLAEVPEPTSDGKPPPEAPRGERWIAPDAELLPEAVAEAADWRASQSSTPVAEPDQAPVVEGTLRAPRRWEQLIVDAAVIGGSDRWERRLTGLGRELELDLAEVDDPESSAAEGIRRQLGDLEVLRNYALPLLETLSSLPNDALWGDWLDQLSAIATSALRHPDRVLSVLSELAPMAGVGPVSLAEVHLVLSNRLLEVAVPPPTSRHGRVFVAPAEAARGMSFDVVCVPGMAEKLFPRQIREDPILLDRARSDLGPGLATNQERISRERLALRIAIGAANQQAVLSYPRLDLEKGRPRVPSFYALEALRAGEGKLPGFGELAARAETLVRTRIGWPAPPDPAHAIDEAEHDLALLDSILQRSEDEAIGTARYLLSANPHLGRALRFRARRWLRNWTPADGLIEPSEPASEVLRQHQLESRSYSPTALERYAECPYRFFLQAIHRLAPREVAVAIDEMNPLQRGSLVHQVQFELFRALQAEGLLPVTVANLGAARDRLDQALDAIALRFREELAPAIERVWAAGVEDVRADLREWLRRVSEDDAGFVPWRFEFAFGLASARERDPESVPEPAPLDCGIQLRGSIDLVERADGRRLRVTDHKTGKARLDKDGVLGGGKSLQPVLYALASEKLFSDQDVLEGRLSYCTAAGGFEVRAVPLDQTARDSAATLANAVGAALSEGFFPAYPEHRACRFCDYRAVCGPYEELRTSRKPDSAPVLRPLKHLRELP